MDNDCGDGWDGDDDDEVGFWGFAKSDDCNEWAYDEFDNLAFGFLLVFIFFPVMFLTACITGILAYRAPTVQDEGGDKETAHAASMA